MDGSTASETPRKPLIAPTTWTKIKSGAAVTGLVVGTVAICAVSTFACAYAQGFGFAKGWKDCKDGKGKEPKDVKDTRDDRDYSSIPLSSGFRRPSSLRSFEDTEAS